MSLIIKITFITYLKLIYLVKYYLLLVQEGRADQQVPKTKMLSLIILKSTKVSRKNNLLMYDKFENINQLTGGPIGPLFPGRPGGP